MAFLPTDTVQAKTARVAVERALAAEGLRLERWRAVPVDPDALGDGARSSMPLIEQAVFRAPDLGAEEAERRCFRAGRRASAEARAAGAHLYLASCSTRTITYKALCAADQLAVFYTDLADQRLRAPFAIFHQRYSTNTTPSWERAQPFRFLCHNGEINTLEGNRAWMRAREGSLGAAALAGPDGADPEELLRPVLDPGGSDSAMLDNAVELLVRGGRDVRHALAMLVPAAVEHDPDASDELRDFYRYHACLTEPWDGPAGLVFTDGRVVGATLDRNGLRPLRYEVCEDGLVVCASEVGAIDLAGHGAVRRGRLGPGQMLCVDPNARRASATHSSMGDRPDEGDMRAAHARPAFAGAGLQTDEDIKRALASSRPWSRWLATHLREASSGEPMPAPEEDLTAAQVAFGFTRELISTVLRPMATGGKEPTASMGDDTPPARLAATAPGARPCRHCWRSARCSTGWSAPAWRPGPAWSPTPASRSTRTTPPPCSATVPARSARASAWPPPPASPRTATPRRRRPATSTPWRRASSRSCPRWASPRWTPTVAPRSSRRSGSTPRWWAPASPVPPRRSAASASTSWARTCSPVTPPPAPRPLGWTTRDGSSTAPAASTTPPTPRSCRPCTTLSARTPRCGGPSAARTCSSRRSRAAPSSATSTSPKW